MALYDMRISYDLFELKDDEAMGQHSPVEFFGRWLKEAIDSGKEVEPNAMTLATCDAFVVSTTCNNDDSGGREGQPDARMVLCKGVDERGFQFFTNYESKKASDLALNARAALVFYWASLHRSVCIFQYASPVLFI
jgi:pyridoxamine 5'-phosphate oxidase